MRLTDEEKKVFEVDEERKYDNPSVWVDVGVLDIYSWSTADEFQKHRMEVTLNFIKRLILECANKHGYQITGNETFDVDEILNNNIKKGKYHESKLNGLSIEHLKDSDKMNMYFRELTRNMSWKELGTLTDEFGFVIDGYRSFFAQYIPPLIDNTNTFYFDLGNEERIKIDTVFDEPIEIKTDLNEEELKNYIKFINTLPKLLEYQSIGKDCLNKIAELYQQKKLEEYYSDEEFSTMFDMIMDHDKTKSSYFFHGTQCVEDAESILESGLFMTRDDIESTAYREFSKDKLLFYSRGFFGEIGCDAIVIIDVLKDEMGREKNIVIPNTNYNVPFTPSGLQGLDGKPRYQILPENIVGYVNKRDKKIVFNPNYKNYDRFDLGNKSK